MPSSSNSAAFSLDEFAKALDKHDYHAEKGQTVHGKICQHANEGVYVDFGGKSPGFVPVQELGLRPHAEIEDSFPLDSAWDFLVTSEQNDEGQVRLSRRQLQIQQSWENLAELEESGKTLEMVVTGTNKGGVVGDVEGLRGFIPRSHLMHKDNMDALVGQVLKAHILEANQDNNKLVLTQRRIQQAESMGKIAAGNIYEGKVAKIQPYGVFVEIEGVTGLLHVSQVSGTRVDSLNTLFAFGQAISVYVQEIDEYKNRISLSTRILETYPGELVEKFDEMMADAPNRLPLVQSKQNLGDKQEQLEKS
ncbi:30S ribosomal protein S1 [Synechocystis sp. PCC 6803]|uniref:Small ribosomal subunit protein bS1B n=1 Tax=Synechocystis sp. (strain ATCC 27184 / PCC 6803 / Kazusa) TaxID=1111708 RepID=RS1B_SYNY3|nr:MULTISPECIES: S1 RNA-binding domain-containing protein [unclassified Synechocystis]P74142.1 RecName: Full=Small ribosomal subunit protein bS1B; AltName: Full=30S ribosomal protein S1 B [Synechocystis sp. PCC 6803 substr. Kazusa]BAM55062.1 30S ribosomal protein S1 [Synechocystis sp. PCC 6803] [Bacillus subtilis BEST7613]AGF51916.1 30S ribosomal protein S1 [Synechocystis sp. PCC 6803]ALJ67886.1 30S ribosomal protein S1 [Synechocystis sp. PCC 6803]AVP89718.1 30S ribosomal protein S1 B [Synecho